MNDIEVKNIFYIYIDLGIIEKLIIVVANDKKDAVITVNNYYDTQYIRNIISLVELEEIKYKLSDSSIITFFNKDNLLEIENVRVEANMSIDQILKDKVNENNYHIIWNNEMINRLIESIEMPDNRQILISDCFDI